MSCIGFYIQGHWGIDREKQAWVRITASLPQLLLTQDSESLELQLKSKQLCQLNVGHMEMFMGQWLWKVCGILQYYGETGRGKTAPKFKASPTQLLTWTVPTNTIREVVPPLLLSGLWTQSIIWERMPSLFMDYVTADLKGDSAFKGWGGVGCLTQQTFGSTCLPKSRAPTVCVWKAWVFNLALLDGGVGPNGSF